MYLLFIILWVVCLLHQSAYSLVTPHRFVRLLFGKTSQNWCSCGVVPQMQLEFFLKINRICVSFFAFYCSIGFIVGMSSTSSYKPLFLDITLHLNGYFSPFHLHLYTSLYPNCIVWRMNWRKWRMAYLAYALFYSSGSFHCAN